MCSPLSHLRRRLVAANPKLLFPPLHHLSTTPTPANRAPTTPMAVLWDLAASRPPSNLPLYDAAVRLHLAATSFGRLRLSAAFLHPSHRLPAPFATTTATAHLYPVYGHCFCAHDARLRHLDTILTCEHAKCLERIDSFHGNCPARFVVPLSLKLSKYAKAARELTTVVDTGSPVDDLRHVGRHLPDPGPPSGSVPTRCSTKGFVGCLMLVLARGARPSTAAGEGEGM